MTKQSKPTPQDAGDVRTTIPLDPLSAYLHRRLHAADNEGLAMAAKLREQTALIADQQRLIDRLEAQIADAAKGKTTPASPKKAREG